MKSENNIINASVIVSSIAELSININGAEAQLHELMQERIKHIKALQKLGFKTVQLGQSKAKAPKTGELAYNIASEMATLAFKASGKNYNEKQLVDATKQFIKRLKFALENGIWVNNPDRDGGKTLENASGKGDTVSPKGKKGTRTPSVFDAKKIADTMSGKYTAAQMKAIIVEMQALLDYAESL
jgi:hypothetical protein